MSVYVLSILVAVLLLVDVRNQFQIAYYRQKLTNNNLKDGVRNMSWYKLWLN